MLTTAPSASARSTQLATRQTGSCSPISAIAGPECAQSGSRRVRHLPTSWMSRTPSIWASRRCVNTGLTSTGSTTPPTRTSCFEGAHARQARVRAVPTPSRFRGSPPELEPVCSHSHTATPSRLGVLKQKDPRAFLAPVAAHRTSDRLGCHRQESESCFEQCPAGNRRTIGEAARIA
jgi:hypothetical protein